MMLTTASRGATVISGSLGGAFKAADGTTSIPTGALVMIVADTGSNGFLDLATGGAIAPGLTGLGTRSFSQFNLAGITAGTSFFGDTVVATSLSGGGGSISSFLPSTDISSYVNKNFAVVWFNVAPATVTSNIAGSIATSFGMIRLADWTFAGSDGGTFSLSPTDASGPTSYYSTGTGPTATQVGGGFFTGTGTATDPTSTAIRSADFTIGVGVPEPSAALLGAFGVLGLLRRRRI